MRRVVYLLCCCLIAGCSGPPESGGPGPNPGDTNGIPPIEARHIVDQKFDEDGKPVWDLKIDKVGLEFTGQSGRGQFEEGSATLYKHGKQAAALAPTSGSYDSVTGTLAFSEGVHFQSLLYATKIDADRIEWRSKQDLIVASGNVEVRKGGFYFGKADVVFADTAGGHVWVETKEERMKANKMLLPLASMVAAATVYPQAIEYGSVRIEGYSSLHSNLEQEGVIKASVLGGPLHLSAPEQGVTIVTDRIDVEVVADPALQGGYKLSYAEAKGDLRFTFTRLGAGEGAQKATVLSGTADYGRYDAGAHTITLRGEVGLSATGDWTEPPGLQGEVDEAAIEFDPATNEARDLALISVASRGLMTLAPDIALTGFASIHLDRSADDKILVNCTGGPARLTSKKEGIDFSAPEIEMMLAPEGEGGGYDVAEAVTKKGLVFKVARLGSGQTGEGALSGRADRGDYDGREHILKLTGNVVVEAKRVFGAKALRNEGDEAVVRLEPETNRLLAIDLISRRGEGSLAADFNGAEGDGDED
jgi:lipopolysaccharide export system protein LptA